MRFTTSITIIAIQPNSCNPMQYTQLDSVREKIYVINLRYGRNITEREMSGRTDYEAKLEDPGLDTIRVLVEEKKASVTKVSGARS